MSVGLYDADMATYLHVPFNLELMKMASYYKKKREIVSLSPAFSPNRHTNFIYRKDYYDGVYDKRLLDYSNIDYGGYAFSNGIYVPMSREIELQKPDTSIYDKYEARFGTSPFYRDFFKKMRLGGHLRLSLDGETVQEDFEKQLHGEKKRVIFFHDFNINDIKDSDYAIKYILNRFSLLSTHPFLAFKFPLQIYQPEDILKWIDFMPAAASYTIQCFSYISDDIFEELVAKTEGTSILDQMEYVISEKSFSENDFLENWLPKIFRQVIFLQMNKRKILLKYEDDFFSDKRWERVIDFLNTYLTWSISYNDSKEMTKSLVFFAQSLLEQYTPGYRDKPFFKPEARELFLFVREKNPELFKMFYECSKVKNVGGTFQNDG